MTRKQQGLGLAAAVAAGGAVLLLLLLALATRSGVRADDPAVGVPLVLGGLVVVATLVAVGWRAVTRRSHSHR